MSIVTVNKFGNSVGVSDAVQQCVTAAIAEATGPLIENAGQFLMAFHNTLILKVKS